VTVACREGVSRLPTGVQLTPDSSRGSLVTQTGNGVSLVELIGRVVDGGHLTASEAEAAFDVCMSGTASEIEMAALLKGI